MNEDTPVSHVAFLVRSVKRAASVLADMGFVPGPEEFWEGEGTREIYVSREQRSSLLLMEATREGPYQRALVKRGPGLHHVALDVTDIDTYLTRAKQAGWKLHAHTQESLPRTRTAYLFRKGLPLIEVQEVKKLSFVPPAGLSAVSTTVARPRFVHRIEGSWTREDILAFATLGAGMGEFMSMAGPEGPALRVGDLVVPWSKFV